MKDLKYIILAGLLLLTAGSLLAQQGGDLNELPTNTLPSEKTLSEIESYSGIELRDAPPGGGPGLGEVIIPIGDLNYTDLLVVALAYGGFVILRKNNNLRRKK